MVAAYWNDPGLLEQALEAGAHPNATDSFGNTALHFATFAPSLEPMRLLLAAGAKVNLQNKRGETPLMSAVRNAQFDQINLLLDGGYQSHELDQPVPALTALSRQALTAGAASAPRTHAGPETARSLASTPGDGPG